MGDPAAVEEHVIYRYLADLSWRPAEFSQLTPDRPAISMHLGPGASRFHGLFFARFCGFFISSTIFCITHLFTNISQMPTLLTTLGIHGCFPVGATNHISNVTAGGLSGPPD